MTSSRPAGFPIVLVAALLAAACGPAKDASVIEASGHVEATDIRIAAKVAGRLLELPLNEGDRLEAGQLIARLDTTDLALARDQATAEQAAAEAELKLFLAGSRREDIAEAEARLQSAEAELSGAERDLARMEQLLAKG